MRVLSFGAGVQSVALLELAFDGEVPKPDVIIFADTQQEPTKTLAVLERSRSKAHEHGIPFEVISSGNLGDFEKNGSIHAPLHFEHDGTSPKKPRGSDGLLFRTCTSRFKIEPVRYRVRDLGATRQEPATMTLGISLDEAATRMRDSEVSYLKNDYPLVELGMTRASCEVILFEKGLEVEKSACVMCPLATYGRRPSTLRDPDDRDLAIDYDRRVRKALPGHPDLYVDHSRVPLEYIIDEADSQLDLFSTCAEASCGI